MNIYETINAVMSDVGIIDKNRTNKQQGFKYRGVDDVMNALSPAFIKHKLCVVPEVIDHIREERTSKNGSSLIYSILKVRYDFLADDGSKVSATVIGEGMDSGDKSSNKALAIAFKYACFQVFCIPTEEFKDPDAECHEVKQMLSEAKVRAIESELNRTGVGKKGILANYKVNALHELSESQFMDCMDKLQKKKDKEPAKEDMEAPWS